MPGPNTITVSAEDGFLNVANAAAQAAVQRNARLGSPLSIALDAAANRALVVDGSADALLAVDLDTGIRTWIADVAIPGVSRQQALPRAVVLDAPRGRALVLDTFSGSIVAVNLGTGQRTILSGPFQQTVDLALDVHGTVRSC
jgi:hypothetical protein